MKTFITLSALVGILAVGSASYAGPAPGQPGLGARAAQLATAKSERNTSAYALTGRSDRDDENPGARAAMGSGRTPIAHRRMPGGIH